METQRYNNVNIILSMAARKLSHTSYTHTKLIHYTRLKNVLFSSGLPAEAGDNDNILLENDLTHPTPS